MRPFSGSQVFLRFVLENGGVNEQEPKSRVLVVDDEPNIVDVVTMALRHHGFEVGAADTGAGALAQVREWRPDVLVLDVMLPKDEARRRTGPLECDRIYGGEHLVVVNRLSGTAGIIGQGGIGGRTFCLLPTLEALDP